MTTPQDLHAAKIRDWSKLSRAAEALRSYGMDGLAESVDDAAAELVSASTPQAAELTDEEFLSMLDSRGIACDPSLALDIKEMLDQDRAALLAFQRPAGQPQQPGSVHLTAHAGQASTAALSDGVKEAGEAERFRCSQHPWHNPDCPHCVAQDTGEDGVAVPAPTDHAAALRRIVSLVTWDKHGATGPDLPGLGWESTARMALDIARAALAAGVKVDAPAQPMKDHEIREVVNAVTRAARECCLSEGVIAEQLRARIADAMSPMIRAARGVPVTGAAQPFFDPALIAKATMTPEEEAAVRDKNWCWKCASAMVVDVHREAGMRWMQCKHCTTVYVLSAGVPATAPTLPCHCARAMVPAGETCTRCGGVGTYGVDVSGEPKSKKVKAAGLAGHQRDAHGATGTAAIPEPLGYVTDVADGATFMLTDENDIGIAVYSRVQLERAAGVTVLPTTEFKEAKATIMAMPEQDVRALAIAQLIQLRFHEKHGNAMHNAN